MLETAMELLRQGDRFALQTIYKETKDSVFALCFSYLRNYQSAEDAAEETYFSVMRYILHYKSNTNPKAWILTIAKNICLNEIKKRKFEVALPEDAENLISSDEILKTKDESGIIQLILKILRKEESAIVIMHAVGSIPLKDIARALGKPYATIRWQYANALKKLKKEISERELL